MSSKVSAIKLNAIMLGVQDVARSKKFYTEGLGAVIEQDYPGFARLTLGDGCSSLALYEWGGYFGYFADPDGYLWKVAMSG